MICDKFRGLFVSEWHPSSRPVSIVVARIPTLCRINYLPIVPCESRCQPDIQRKLGAVCISVDKPLSLWERGWGEGRDKQISHDNIRLEDYLVLNNAVATRFFTPLPPLRGGGGLKLQTAPSTTVSLANSVNNIVALPANISLLYFPRFSAACCARERHLFLEKVH